MNDILSFSGVNRWLSNFAPCLITYEGMDFLSVEAAYVAAKTDCVETRLEIQRFDTPRECKRYGKGIELRDGWESMRLDVMEHLLRQKFKAGTLLGDRLKATGNCLIVEGNTWGDTFWGQCHGVGHNHLGKMIMQIRSTL